MSTGRLLERGRNVKKVWYCALVASLVLVFVLGKTPSGINQNQAIRAWYNLGLYHARQGDYDLAKTCFESVREIGDNTTLLWNQATMSLAVTCEALGLWDEANYYFASEEAKHHIYANRLRNEFPGAWRNIRKIAGG